MTMSVLSPWMSMFMLPPATAHAQQVSQACAVAVNRDLNFYLRQNRNTPWSTIQSNIASRWPECNNPSDLAAIQATNSRGGIVAAADEPVTCTAWYHFLYPTCLWRGAMAALGTTFISLSAWFLAAAGLIFNFTLDYTIVEFGSKVYTPVKAGVELGWQLFRDVGNIVIIGIFTFVAISMILNNTTFGTKQMVAKVLIVAVLINFSLLFSKLVIDTSHFIAHQFYTAALSQVAGTSSSAGSGIDGINPTSGFANAGIAGQFIKLTGLSGAWDTFGALSKLSDNTQSGLITLLYGIMIAVFVLGAAGLLLYATFLLVARTVLLIVLIATSALAFASLLIPADKFQEGWNKWLQSLLRSALFAPMLMLMLWFTLLVGNQLTRTNGSLADFINNPASTAGLTVALGYLLMIGLLYASIRIAGSFSHEIAGMASAGRLTALAGAIPFAVGARMAAPVGRFALGRPARAIGGALNKAAGKEGRSAAAASVLSNVGNRFGKLGKSDFNALQGGIGSAVAKQMGLSQKTVAGAKLGGIDGILKKKSEAAAERGEAVAKSRDPAEIDRIVKEETEKTRVEKETTQKEMQQTAAEQENAERKRAAAEKQKATVQKSLQQQEQVVETKKKDAATLEQRGQQEKDTATGRHEIEMAKAGVEIAEAKRLAEANPDDTAIVLRHKQLEAAQKMAEDKHQAELEVLAKQHTDRMAPLQTEIAALTQTLEAARPEIESKIEELDATIQSADAEAEKAKKELVGRTEAAVKARRDHEAAEVATKRLVETGAYDAERHTQVSFSMSKKEIADGARKKLLGKASDEKIKNVLGKIVETGEAPAAPPAAPTGEADH